jgi:acetyl-CoA carboxylase carboxyl transferase subunit alpha
MLKDYLDFEKEIQVLDSQIKELEILKKSRGLDYSEAINELILKRTQKVKNVYSDLSPWQIVQVARHPNRPIFQDYINNIITDFSEMHGDRCFGDDRAIITGLGKIGRHKVMVVGQNKGKTIDEKKRANFGHANPEGYRKAIAKMKFAEKYNLPVVTFIDTPGAYPGICAEERGQASAIANSLMEMSRLKSPIVSIVIGEGGSGGALGIGVADRFAMLENSYYSVISPEGCAAILWKSKDYAKDAAEALKLTSKDLYRLKLIDDIIKEPLGGAHRNYHDTFYNVQEYVNKKITELKNISLEEILDRRYKKLRSIGNFRTEA